MASRCRSYLAPKALQPLAACLALGLAGCAPPAAVVGHGASVAPSASVAPATSAVPAMPAPARSAAPTGIATPAPTGSPAAGSSPAASVAPEPAGPVAVSFRGAIAPVLERSCAGCHAPGRQGVRDVAIFDAGGQVRYDEVRGALTDIIRTCERGSMPRGGNPKLSADEVDLLRRWQAEGAADN